MQAINNDEARKIRRAAKNSGVFANHFYVTINIDNIYIFFVANMDIKAENAIRWILIMYSMISIIDQSQIWTIQDQLTLDKTSTSESPLTYHERIRIHIIRINEPDAGWIGMCESSTIRKPNRVVAGYAYFVVSQEFQVNKQLYECVRKWIPQ